MKAINSIVTVGVVMLRISHSMRGEQGQSMQHQNVALEMGQSGNGGDLHQEVLH